MTVLVTGATGNVGRLVTDRLLAAGVRVRAMTRTPAAARLPGGVEVVRGDLTAPDTLPPALDGVERVFLFPEPSTADAVVDRAAASGVRRIVTLSSGAVTSGDDTGFHVPVEQAVQQSGLEWTHVRPGEFMLNKLWLWGPSIRAERVVYDPYPEAAWYPVHESDIADVAAAALLNDGHSGNAYTLNGPELVSHRDQVAAIAGALGEEVRFERVTPEQARERYLAQGGFAAAMADFLVGFEDYSGEAADPHASAPEPDIAGVEKLTTADAIGTPARPFAQWARDHSADFR
ncbi:uncharacterized protein YbjT (DUF2867 family) [Lipingzhangella halophila]|uniref:Uncharacterized protein YbjT (DUF2867 family) n=1 Tax=Lipingzhangella halophila TaxID=1783352 RepID=A0A7W7W0L5_9ACTN|nr:NAD(P)H-binding protein [Lipingzhangella halophila]MBB4929746.1 uncharacterized protein YbjT (DUF2867 family) [Lipingzhangella halophila]